MNKLDAAISHAKEKILTGIEIDILPPGSLLPPDVKGAVLGTFTISSEIKLAYTDCSVAATRLMVRDRIFEYLFYDFVKLADKDQEMQPLKNPLNDKNRAKLKKYVCHKEVHATSMDRKQYNHFRGWELPANENGDDAGMLVVYQLNTDKEYISWSPLGVFEEGYSEISE